MEKVRTVFLSQPYGFCSGVKSALNIVDQALQKFKDKKIYIINEIVHNKTIVEDLFKKGVVFTKDVSSIPEGSVVIFSAHGVAPTVKQELSGKDLMILDATCPLVQKVHDEVKNYSKKGYHIIYICNKEHDEARGVIGENPANISVVENEADIEKIPAKFNNYAVLMQTTLDMFEVEKIVKEIKQRFPQVEFPEKKDLCFTTTLRQKAAKENAKKCDLFLVVGSKNSSNSKKLRDIAENSGCNAYLIDNYEEIKPDWLENVNSICLTSGASVPDRLINEILDLLTKKHGFNYTEKA